MLLALDVGNTNTVIALYDGDKLKQHWRMATDKHKASDEIGLLILQFLTYEGVSVQNIEDVIISSVVPPIMHSLTNAIRRYIDCEPLVIGPGIKTGMNIRLDNPKELGADRIVNAVAALHKYGAPLIVVDFGTATTYCVIDKDGNYIGGMITAGIKISMDALFERASKLPKIEILRPETVIGRNTVSAMQAGAIFGQVGQVEGIVRRIKEELCFEKCTVIATGGLANTIAPETEAIDTVDPMLTLDGLKLIYDRNK
ncbi:MAG: type III pantothenate kinase [Oscillospiraceae bacterium]